MIIEPSPITVKSSQEEIFDFLTKVENFEFLMPNTIQKFEMTSQNGFTFALSGMPEISLVLKHKIKNSKLEFESINNKVPFYLNILIHASEDDLSLIELKFKGEFNAMLNMLVKKPLTNFLNHMSNKLRQKYS